MISNVLAQREIEDGSDSYIRMTYKGNYETHKYFPLWPNSTPPYLDPGNVRDHADATQKKGNCK